MDYNQILEETFYKAHPWGRGRVILLCYAGSIAYGTNTPESDVDLRGIVLPPKDYIFGLKNFESYHSPEGGENDIVVYSLRKYLQLAMLNNPNVLEILFTDMSDTPICNRYGHRLREVRSSFMSRKIFTTFSGYAYAQLHRMMEREGKPNHGVGNPERQAIRERIGFDPKNAMHLVRIMREGKEALETGEIQVKRPDFKELLEIKRGEVPIQKVIDEHDALYAAMLELRDSSILPEEPDFDAINDFLVNLVEDLIGDKDSVL